MLKQTEVHLGENQIVVCFYDTMAYLFSKYNIKFLFI